MTDAACAAEVAAAIANLCDEFPGTAAVSDGSGGAYVDVPDIGIGPRWTPEVITVRFQISYNYPDAAIYPFFAPAGLRRAEGTWPSNMTEGVPFNGETAIQISLRANRWHPGTDTANGAVHQVRKWLMEVP